MVTQKQPWLNARQSGILAHISSLPSPIGIGNLGASAHAFVDFLAAAGFSNWQVCPVGPTGYGDSPYQSFSAFAGNPYFIDLTKLVSLDLLDEREIRRLRSLPKRRVDYGGLYQNFWNALATAFERIDSETFALDGHPPLEEFLEQNSYWIDAYTDFMAFKRRFCYKPWTEWPTEFRTSSISAAANLDESDRLEKSRHAFYQYLFFCQWSELKAYANLKGIDIIGDMPIYVALDSADAWSHREIFRIDENGTQETVAGVPPDYFSDTGQLWGNPLYDWKLLAKNGYGWWIDRINASLELFDAIRLDHFRAFQDYWVVPAKAPDASKGHWEKGPGIDFFRAALRQLPSAKLIAEDLGYINREVYELRQATGFPGMKIMQFGFGHDDNNVNLPHFFDHNQVVYTGTHDNDTTQGWLDRLPSRLRNQVFDYFGNGQEPTVDRIIEAAFASVARLAIFPLQDLLGLASKARMNLPGSATGNWQWRLTQAQFERLLSHGIPKYQRLNQRYHRTGDSMQRDFSEPPINGQAIRRQAAEVSVAGAG